MTRKDFIQQFLLWAEEHGVILFVPHYTKISDECNFGTNWALRDTEISRLIDEWLKSQKLLVEAEPT